MCGPWVHPVVPFWSGMVGANGDDAEEWLQELPYTGTTCLGIQSDGGT